MADAYERHLAAEQEHHDEQWTCEGQTDLLADLDEVEPDPDEAAWFDEHPHSRPIEDVNPGEFL